MIAKRKLTLSLFTKIIFTLLFIFHSNYSLAMTENLLGTWQGKINDQELEISVWLAKVSSFPNNTNVRGYAISSDGKCVRSIEGSLNNNPLHSFFYKIPPEIGDKSLSIDFPKLKGYPNACARSLPTVLLHDGDDINQVVIVPLLNKNEKNRVESFVRVSASQKMMELIKKNPPNDGTYRLNAVNRPSNQELNLIRDHFMAKQDFLKQFKIPCDDLIVEALWKLKQHGIFEIQILANSDNTVEVSSRISGKNDHKTLLKLKGIDWNHLSMSRKELNRFKPSCRKAEAVLGYVKALEEGAFSRISATSRTNFKSIEDVKNFYLIDASGVDKIFYGGDSMHPGVVERAFGTTTIFLPGDVTRRVVWDVTGQSLNILNTAKNSETGQIEDDILSKKQNHIFRTDGSLSQKYSTDIWSSRREGMTNPNVCIKWAEKHHIDTCVERSHPTTNQPHRYFLTKDFEAAKRLFRFLSPNARMGSSSNGMTPVEAEGKCISNIFCSYSGGDYLNAVYEGDITKVRKLDLKYFKAINDLTKQISNPLVKELFGLMTNNNHPSLLPLLAREYMHDYKNQKKDCFRPGAQKITFNKKTDEYVTYDWLGNEMSRSGGILMHGEYIVNAEFVDLCKAVCGVRGWGNALWSNQVVVASIPTMRIQHDCDSEEIKQFEKNLISLQALKHTGYKVYYQRNSP